MKDLVEKLQREKQMKQLGIESTDEGFTIKVPARTLRGKNYNFMKTVTYKGRRRLTHDEVVTSLLSYKNETLKHPDCIRYKEYIENKNKGKGVKQTASSTGVQYLGLSYNKVSDRYRLAFNCNDREKSKGYLINGDNIESVLRQLDQLKHETLGTDLLTESEFEAAANKIRHRYEHHKAHGKWPPRA